MIRKMLFGVICIAFVATGTLNAFEVEWKTEGEYKKPVEDINGAAQDDEKKKILDEIYDEEMKYKSQPPDSAYEFGESEIQVQQQTLPPASGAFGSDTQGSQIVDQPLVPTSPPGTAPTIQNQGIGTTGLGAPVATAPVGPAASGCQGPTIGLFGDDASPGGQQTAAQYPDDYSQPIPANQDQPGGLSSGQFYNSEENEDVDEEENENESGNSQQQR